jgi:hypothetical protein
LKGSKSELQALYSAEPAFADASAYPHNLPSVFTAVLNKKGQSDTAILNEEYYVQRVKAALKL